MSKTTWLKCMELTGSRISLVPLAYQHKEPLLAAAADGNLWELWYTGVPGKKTIDHYIEFALKEQKEGHSLPFAVKDNHSGKILGSTRFCHAEASNKRLEIGYTWYAKSVQKTSVNTECKYLLLKHAFEQLACIAVEFRTHWHNQASRAAIARLGAKQDAVLRNHKIMPDGSYRDTVVFSIIENEWPAVKTSLQHRINRYSNGAQ